VRAGSVAPTRRFTVKVGLTDEPRLARAQVRGAIPSAVDPHACGAGFWRPVKVERPTGRTTLTGRQVLARLRPGRRQVGMARSATATHPEPARVADLAIPELERPRRRLPCLTAYLAAVRVSLMPGRVLLVHVLVLVVNPADTRLLFARAFAGGLSSRRGFLVGPAPERSGGAPACPCRPALPAARAARQGRLEDVQKVLTGGLACASPRLAWCNPAPSRRLVVRTA
jgi:hypothetical protein